MTLSDIRARDVHFPSVNGDAIVINPRNARIGAIIQGLFSKSAIQTIPTVWLSPFVQMRRAGLLDSAERSATRQHRGGFARTAKRLFLLGQYNWMVRRLRGRMNATVVCWNGIKGHRRLAMEAARACGLSTLYLEEAPLPGRLTVDLCGVNFENSLPREREFYRQWMAGSQIDAEVWRRIRSDIVPREAKGTSDVAQRDADNALGDENYIFCPLQVPGDSQITVYGDWIRSVEHMIDVLHIASHHLPDGWHLRLKEHPSAKTSFREKILAQAGRKFRLDNETNTMQQIEAAQAVATINSSVGLEAFFCDKPVLVFGNAFYGFDGLARKLNSPEEVAQVLAAPQDLTFDADARGAFMTYLCTEYFPLEEDVIAGRYTVADVISRDQRAAEILQKLHPEN